MNNLKVTVSTRLDIREIALLQRMKKEGKLPKSRAGSISNLISTIIKDFIEKSGLSIENMSPSEALKETVPAFNIKGKQFDKIREKVIRKLERGE